MDTLAIACIVASILVSFVAVGVSVFNLSTTKRQLYTTSVTNNRIVWIVNVRKLIGEFMDLYIRQGDKTCLISKKASIDLYLNILDNPEQQQLSKTLQIYIENKDMGMDELLRDARVVLRRSWERMKLETSYSKQHKKKIQKRLSELIKDHEVN